MRNLLVLLGAALVTPVALSHDHTQSGFVRAAMQTQVRARVESEPAHQPEKIGEVSRLTVELSVDGERQPAAGLVRMTNLSTGKPLELKDGIFRDQHWYAIHGRTSFLVPKAPIRIEAFHGLTTRIGTREMDLTHTSEAVASLALKSFYNPTAKNLIAGNTHLHLMKLTREAAWRYLETVPRADGLHLVFLSYLERANEDHDYISNTFTAGDLADLSQNGLLFGTGEEHRHNFAEYGEGYGHVMFLNLRRLIKPVSIGPGIMKSGTDGISLQKGIQTARANAATVIWCHNTLGHEDIPNWLEGLLDAQNIFDGGSEGTYDETFYRYLNLGLRVPFSTGTDWFIYDFSRVYVPLAGELNAKRWLTALTEGRSFITNGTFLEFEVTHAPAGGRTQSKPHKTRRSFQPGDTVDAHSGDELVLTGRAIGRSDFGHLELIANGRLIDSWKSVPRQGYFEITMERALTITEPGWIALRIPPPEASIGGIAPEGAIRAVNELGKPLYAHTSPIYIEMARRRIFRPEVAEELIGEMESSMRSIADRGVFSHSDAREKVLSVYKRGIGRLNAMLEAH